MIVRYEIYHHGIGSGTTLTDEDAKTKFEELKLVAKCGWAELIDDDGNVIDSFDNKKVATLISRLEM